MYKLLLLEIRQKNTDLAIIYFSDAGAVTMFSSEYDFYIVIN